MRAFRLFIATMVSILSLMLVPVAIAGGTGAADELPEDAGDITVESEYETWFDTDDEGGVIVRDGLWHGLEADCGLIYSIQIPDTYDPERGATLVMQFHGHDTNHKSFFSSGVGLAGTLGSVFVCPQAPRGMWGGSANEKLVLELMSELEAKGLKFTRRLAFGKSFAFIAVNNNKLFDGIMAFSCFFSGSIPKGDFVRDMPVAIVANELHGTYQSSKAAYERFVDAGFKHTRFVLGENLSRCYHRPNINKAMGWVAGLTAFVESAPLELADADKKLESADYRGALDIISKIIEELAERKRGEKFVVAALSLKGEIEKAAGEEASAIRKLKRTGSGSWAIRYWRFSQTFGGTEAQKNCAKSLKKALEKRRDGAGAIFECGEAAREEEDYFAAFRAHNLIAQLYPDADFAEESANIVRDILDDKEVCAGIESRLAAEFEKTRAAAAAESERGRAKEAAKLLEGFICEYPGTAQAGEAEKLLAETRSG